MVIEFLHWKAETNVGDEICRDQDPDMDAVNGKIFKGSQEVSCGV